MDHDRMNLSLKVGLVTTIVRDSGQIQQEVILIEYCLSLIYIDMNKLGELSTLT